MAQALEVLGQPRVPVEAPASRHAPGGPGGGGFDRGERPGGGGGGEGDAERVDAHQPSIPISAPIFAMGLLLVGVVMLFSGLVASYIVFRMGAGANWPPQGFPALPATLWVPTAIVLASSITMALAQRSARAGEVDGLTLRLGMTTLLGLSFVAAQVVIWQGLVAEGLVIRRSVYGAIFYVLTGLHAFHMVTGVLALATTLWNARRGRYTARSHMGVRLTAIYWHFLGGLWVFLFAILYLV